jgi:hypothetical protein
MSPAQRGGRRLVSVELYWLPLGAGDAKHCVRWNSRIFEAISARIHQRPACDLYHSALIVHLGGDRYAIEMAPAWGNQQPDRGVVGEGAVGLPWLGRSRFFPYEIRRWRNGTIPDIAEAVASPQRLGTDIARSQQLLDLVPAFPAATWGRDELDVGEMWNSNSLIAWLLARSGHRTGAIDIPAHGRAPGWAAGLAVAAWQDASAASEAAPAASRHAAVRNGVDVCVSLAGGNKTSCNRAEGTRRVALGRGTRA